MGMFRKLFRCENQDLSLFFVRLGVALIFIVHGWDKLQNIDSTVAFFATLGLPALFAYLILIVELVGGILLLLGFFVSVLGWVFAFIMVFAIILVKAEMGFIGGYEFDLMLLLASLALAFSREGKYSLQKVFGR